MPSWDDIVDFAADKAGIDLSVLEEGVDFIVGLFDWDDCGSDNEAKYRKIVRDATPAEIEGWLAANRVASSTGNCAKYAWALLAERALTERRKAPAGNTVPLARYQALLKWRSVEIQAARMVLRELGIDWGAATAFPTRLAPKAKAGESEDDYAMRVVPRLAGALDQARMIASRSAPELPPDDEDGSLLGILIGTGIGFFAGRATGKNTSGRGQR